MTLQLGEAPRRLTPSGVAAAHRRARADTFVGRTLWDPDLFSTQAAASNLRVAGADELPEIHALAENIMDMRLAPLWSLASAHGHTKASAWVHGDPHLSGPSRPTGLFLILPLNWNGEAALRGSRFNFQTPRLDELCAPGDEVAAIYFWLTAGKDSRARRNVMRAALSWVDAFHDRIRFYARAGSDDGARALAGLHFRRMAPDAPNLFLLDRRA